MIGTALVVRIAAETSVSARPGTSSTRIVRRLFGLTTYGRMIGVSGAGRR